MIPVFQIIEVDFEDIALLVNILSYIYMCVCVCVML